MEIKIKAILRTDLGKKESNKEYRIDLRIYLVGKQYKLSTNQYCKEKYWDKKAGYPVSNIQDKEYCQKALVIRAFISDKENKFNRYCIEKDFNNEPISLDEIKLLLKGENVTTTNSNKPKTVEAFFDLYIKTLKNNNKRDNSIKNIESSKRAILAFIKKKYKRELLAKDIDRAFLLNLKDYLINDVGNKTSTANKKLRNLRSALLEVIRHGWGIKNPFIQNIITQDEPKNIALTKEEYEQFKKVILPPNASKGMKLAKDLYILSCETGLRISDVKNFKSTYVKKDSTTGREYIELIQIKNNNLLTIGLTNQAKAIIIKYKKKSKPDHYFGSFCEQQLNRNIKKIASITGIQKNITFHTARHTFATFAARCGNNEIQIATLLGDKDTRMARIYVNLNKNDKLKIFDDYIEDRKKL